MIARIPLTAKVPVFIDEQPEGGYTVTSPLFPELITEGDTIEEVLRNIQEVFGMVIEDYVDEEGPLPRGPVRRRHCRIPRTGGYNLLRYREVTRKLARLGCVEDTRRRRGSHRKWFNPSTRRSTSVPDWGRHDLAIGTLAQRSASLAWTGLARL